MSDSQGMTGGDILMAFLMPVAIVCFILRVGEVITVSWWWFLPLGIMSLPVLLVLSVVFAVVILFVELDYRMGQPGGSLTFGLILTLAWIFLTGTESNESVE